MAPVPVTLLRAVTYDRPADPDRFRPLPAGYAPERLTVVRADEVRAGDLYVGSVVQPVTRTGTLRYATYIYAPYVAHPTPYDPQCHKCRSWMGDPEMPAVCLYPHTPTAAGELVAVIVPDRPVGPAPVVCVNACTCRRGRVPLDAPAWTPWPVCWTCHGQPCRACMEGGSH